MTIQYYQTNADQFFNDTINVDMSSLYVPFTSLLPKDSLILDAGCGSGRDSKAFIDMGFNVKAFDASSEMVKRACQVTALNVEQMSFIDVQETQQYDAIWTCASLLHVPEAELPMVIGTLVNALKNNGIWYMSFKYGDLQRKKEGRLFTDMNEARFEKLMKRFPQLKINQQWITEDKRPARTERWLNILLSKSNG